MAIVSKGIDSVSGRELFYDTTTNTFSLGAQAPTPTEPPPVSSSGAIVQESQQATNDSSRTQNLQVPVVDASQVNRAAPADDAQLQAQTGAVSNVSSPEDIQRISQTQNAVATPNDDAVTPKQTAIGTASSDGSGRPVIAAEFSKPITARPNPLAKLASMTYSISIYLMNKDEYTQLLQTQKKVLPTSQLLIQSGGIQNQSSIGQRNQFFDVDFYIDDLVVNSTVGTQSAGAAHNVTDLKFTIIEPNGITLLKRLDAASKAHSKYTSSPINAVSQNYLMVIRFYGYTQDGKKVNGAELGITEVGSDSNTIVEKWIPFQIADINYRISSKAVEYTVKATVPQTQVAFSQVNGTIPFNIELTGDTINTIINGPGASAQGGPGATADASAGASSLGSRGLCNALNQYQKDQVTKGLQEIADEYEIVIENVPGLINAKMMKQGAQEKARSQMNQSDNAASKLLDGKTSYDKLYRNVSVAQGTQIVQFLDVLIRNSTYITSQQNLTYDENDPSKPPSPQSPVNVVQWFRIRSRVTPKGYDSKRRNYAYKITYYVTRYQIVDPKSPYFPTTGYRGPHKVYNYWFTGQNTEVLDFNIEVNANYLTVVGNDAATSSTANGRWFEKRAFQTRPGESSQGGQYQSTMPAAQLAERLYSAADVAKVDMQILGDPDWLQQTEVFYIDQDLSPWKPDGSVNFDASEALFEVRFNPPADYDLQKGIIPVNKSSMGTGSMGISGSEPQERIVYTATTVESQFKQGKFIQQLKGTVRDDLSKGSAQSSGAQSATNNVVGAPQMAGTDGTSSANQTGTGTPVNQAGSVETIGPGDGSQLSNTPPTPYTAEKTVTSDGLDLALDPTMGRIQQVAAQINPSAQTTLVGPDDDGVYDP